MLFSLPVMYNCIYILSFLGFKDTSFANLASTSHVFDNVRMLPSKIPHPQPVLSITCRYSPQKFCIFNPRKSTIADIIAQYPLRSITSSQSYLLSNIHTSPQLPIRFLPDFLFAPAILHTEHILLKHIHTSHPHIPDSMVLS